MIKLVLMPLSFFNLLSGYSDPPIWNKFIVAPLGLREKIIQLIDQEIQGAENGRQGRIIDQNELAVRPEIIIKLYEASNKR